MHVYVRQMCLNSQIRSCYAGTLIVYSISTCFLNRFCIVNNCEFLGKLLIDYDTYRRPKIRISIIGIVYEFVVLFVFLVVGTSRFILIYIIYISNHISESEIMKNVVILTLRNK